MIQNFNSHCSPIYQPSCLPHVKVINTQKNVALLVNIKSRCMCIFNCNISEPRLHAFFCFVLLFGFLLVFFCGVIIQV